MLNFSTPVSEKHSYNNFSMKEKAQIAKINLRGDLENKDFVNKIRNIIGMMLPKESCNVSEKKKSLHYGWVLMNG